jgi:alpha-tubulin suppressor-like RCC1 family protein
LIGARLRFALCALAAGCLDVDAFRCRADADCSGGACEATGFCSRPDPACQPAGRRYVEFAGKGFGGACVGARGDCVAQIAVGGHHTCARKVDGTLWCWGDNTSGQLGGGAVGTFQNRSTPTQVVMLQAATEIVASYQNTCARAASGVAYCWGNNFAGAVGDGTTNSAGAPTAVSALANVAGIGVGQAHSCAVGSDGSPWCWGRNAAGQLGDGSTTDRLQPVAVAQATGLSAVAEIGGGLLHSCARTAGGAVWCWGSNQAGQLGSDSADPSLEPVAVPALAPVRELSSGGSHVCAIDGDHRLWCWGDNSSGQIGSNAAGMQRTPVAVANLPPVAHVAAALQHSCAIDLTGAIYCWGANGSGQLGDGTTTSRAGPKPVAQPALRFATRISAGDDHSCAIADDGAIWCWGGNGSGQLGDGTTVSRPAPVRVGLTCP